MKINTFLFSFFRYQIAAIIATGIDFGVYFLLKDGFHVWYVVATAVGAFSGAVVNFIICRNWAFAAKETKITLQASKYIIVSAGSLLLNTLLVFVFTNYFLLHENYSRVITAIFVAVTYNFLLQKYFVFKR